MNNEIRMSCINTATEISDELSRRANMINNLLSSSEAWNILDMAYGEKYRLLEEKRRELLTIERIYWKAANAAYKIMAKI